MPWDSDLEKILEAIVRIRFIGFIIAGVLIVIAMSTKGRIRRKSFWLAATVLFVTVGFYIVL